MMNKSAATAAKSSDNAPFIKTNVGSRTQRLIALLIVAHFTLPTYGVAQTSRIETLSKRLKSAYPADIANISDGVVVFNDGTRLSLDDGKEEKSFADWLAQPDIEDMFRFEYRADKNIEAPPKNFDPGRARNVKFFNKIYGNCANGEVAKHLVDITWLPKKSGTRIKVSSLNGVAEKFRAVSAELDKLPSRFDAYLVPTAGTYVCRNIAGTNTPSAHGYGIAIDIAIKNADYWRWSKHNRTLTKSGDAEAAARQYRNRIPIEIVQIFEKHGFIWGGRWYHYDTMHFEYRPELLPPISQ